MGIDVAEALMPFEIDTYVNLLREWMEKQQQKAQQLGYHVG